MKISAKWILLILLAAGCAARSYEVAAPGSIPAGMPDWDIGQSPHFEELKRNYGRGLHYEQAKIKYLLGETAVSKYEFDRNGMVYGGARTAKHLRKKYRQRASEIKTARGFIENVASISNTSGRSYYALPGDGKAYRTGDILHYELDRLEEYMDNLNKAG